MNILYLHQYFVSADEPGATRSYEIARRLVAAGHCVDLLTTDRSNVAHSDWTTCTVDGIRVHSIGVPYNNAMNFRSRVRAFSTFALQARAYGRSLEYDLVYATSTPLTIAWPAVQLSKDRQVPMVFEVRDLWPEVPIAIGAIKSRVAKRLAYKLERYAYSNASTVVALSPGMADSISARYVGTRVETIPNACDLDLFMRRPSSGDKFRASNHWLESRPLIVYAGTFGKANGVDYAVRIGIELSKIAPEARMLLIGAGKYAEAVRDMAQSAGLLDKSIFVRGPVAKKDIPEILHAADVALSLFIDLPVLSTNSANKFFDAIAAGTAVAINYSGWQADLIQSTECGLVLPANSPAEAARQLATFLEDKKRVATAGIHARRLAETEFSRDVLVDQLRSLLEEIGS